MTEKKDHFVLKLEPSDELIINEEQRKSITAELERASDAIALILGVETKTKQE